MATQRSTDSKHAQAALGVGTAFIAIGVVLLTTSNDNNWLWAGGMILVFAGAMTIGAGFALGYKRTK